MKRIQAFFVLLAIPLSISAQNMGLKLTAGSTPNTTLDVNGSTAYREGTALNLTGAVGNIYNDIVLTDYSLFRITGPTAIFSITGFAGGQNGRVITLINATSFTLTFTHQATSGANNQINTGGSSLELAANGVATLIYNPTLLKWVVSGGIGFINNWSLSGNDISSMWTSRLGTTGNDALNIISNNTSRLFVMPEGGLAFGRTDGGYSTPTNFPTYGTNVTDATIVYPTQSGGVSDLRTYIVDDPTDKTSIWGATVASTDLSTYGERFSVRGDGQTHIYGKTGIGTANPDANLHLYGVGKSGFTPTSHGVTGVHGAEIAFSANGFSNPAASIQLLDYNAYSSGLCFNVHKGTNNGGTGTFADNWPTDVLQAMTIDNRGYVGIGTTSPGAALHVSSNSAGLYNDMLLSGYNNADIPVFNIRRARGTDVAPVNLVAGDGLGGNHYYGYVGGGWSYLSGVFGTYEGNGTNTLSSLSFMASNSTRMIIDETGNVGINTTTPGLGFKLSVNGTAEKSGGGSWSTYSDSRVKRNVRQFTEGLATLEKINPVWFQYNNKSGYEDTTKTYVGVIAQELEKVAPYMVEKTKTANFDDQRVYDSNALNYILVNSVKELSVENKKLKAENEALKAAIEKNSHDIESIKAMLDKKQH
jgi:hypothetical protein